MRPDICEKCLFKFFVRPKALCLCSLLPFPSAPFRNSVTSLRTRLCHKLNDTTGLGDLLLGQLADVSCADNDGGLGQTALAEQLGVAEGGEVDDGGGFGLGQVLLARLGGDQRPQLSEWEEILC